MTCREANELVDVYFDGQFSHEDRLRFESHIEHCAECRERTQADRRTHEWLRSEVAKLPAEPPPELFDRIEGALAEVEEASRARRQWGWGRRALSGGAIVVAAAAGVVLWVKAHEEPIEASLVEAIVRNHQRDLPVEVASADPDSVRHWFKGKVDVPVRPPQPTKAKARLVGGRVSHMREKDAAQLVYDVSGRRVSVLIFDPQGLPISGSQHKRVRDRDVMLEGRRGYNVAFFEDRGLGYAVAAEGGDSDVIDFVNAAFTAP